jgi:hypothetical protein
MLGHTIQSNQKVKIWANNSFVLIFIGVILGFWIGPISVILNSIVGLTLASVSLFLSSQLKSIDRPLIFPLICLVIHLGLLILSVILYVLFLNPLSDQQQKLPKFRYVYSDPENLFTVKGPEGWDYEPLVSASKLGVRIHPRDRQNYMGISEITILIDPIITTPKDIDKFLENVARHISDRKSKGKEIFNMKIEPAQLINGETGMWSILDAKKLWVPIRQISLIGIKNKKYVCSISAIGLKNHSKLSKIVCLGLFESLQFNSLKK